MSTHKLHQCVKKKKKLLRARKGCKSFSCFFFVPSKTKICSPPRHPGRCNSSDHLPSPASHITPLIWLLVLESFLLTFSAFGSPQGSQILLFRPVQRPSACAQFWLHDGEGAIHRLVQRFNDDVVDGSGAPRFACCSPTRGLKQSWMSLGACVCDSCAPVLPMSVMVLLLPSVVTLLFLKTACAYCMS